MPSAKVRAGGFVACLGLACLACAVSSTLPGCGDDSGGSRTVSPSLDSATLQDTFVATEDVEPPEPDSAAADTRTIDSGRDTATTATDSGRDTSTTPDTAPACSAGKFDCNGTCINVLGTDPNNCGHCARSCGSVGTAGPACRDGTCYCASGLCEGSFVHCVLPDVECLFGCHDLASDPLSCGACGVVCAAGESCTSGRCCLGTKCSSCGDAVCRAPYEDKTSCPTDCH